MTPSIKSRIWVESVCLGQCVIELPFWGLLKVLFSGVQGRGLVKDRLESKILEPPSIYIAISRDGSEQEKKKIHVSLSTVGLHERKKEKNKEKPPTRSYFFCDKGL